MSSSENRIFSQLRLKRICAFIIDICAVALLACAAYSYFRIPDYFIVKQLMDNVNQAGAGASQEMVNLTLALFNTAYLQTLLIWLGYEIICQFLFMGATLGKLAMRIRVVPLNPVRRKPLHYLLMAVRSILKILFAYVFQGIPLLLAALTIFTSRESQSGYDMIVKSKVACIEAERGQNLNRNSIEKDESEVSPEI